MVLVACMASACGMEPETALSEQPPAAVHTVGQEANSTRKVLILGSSVRNAAQSREAQAAASAGFAVEVVTPAQWQAKRAADFMSYRALIIGDAGCTGSDNAFKAAVDSRLAWGHIVDGNVVIVGADPSSNETPALVENAIKAAAERPNKTGMYVALGCAYRNAQPGTAVPLLEPFGVFKVAGVQCADAAHLFAMKPETLSESLTDGVLVGTACAARSVFTEYPERNFAFAALAMSSSGAPVPSQRAYTDYTNETPAAFVGTPYVLVRGAMAAGAGCGFTEPAPDEECDLGDGGNGQPKLPHEAPTDTCSWSCRNNWCGDGVVDTQLGEQCDEGIANGRTRDSSGSIGRCSASCKLATNLPPVVRCKPVTVDVVTTCGSTADINDGSYDPEGDPLTCTQSPASQYALGQTSVTLTCQDRAGLSASCTATVAVNDRGLPVLTLKGAAAATVECGTAYADPGATASDLCAGNLTGAIVKSGAVNASATGSYALNYSVADPAGNAASRIREVRVADTKPPQIVCPAPIVTELTEGNLATVSLGLATATDACDGAVRVQGPQDTLFPEGETKVTFTATDAAGNQASCESSVTVMAAPRGEEPWDGAMLGDGFGCGATGGGAAPLTLLGLALSALLGARRRQR
jgi:uncharacterized protein (TIGR03382 family)